MHVPAGKCHGQQAGAGVVLPFMIGDRPVCPLSDRFAFKSHFEVFSPAEHAGRLQGVVALGALRARTALSLPGDQRWAGDLNKPLEMGCALGCVTPLVHPHAALLLHPCATLLVHPCATPLAHPHVTLLVHPCVSHLISASLCHPVSASLGQQLSGSCSPQGPILGLEELKLPHAGLNRGRGRDLGGSLSKSYY